MIVSVLAAAPPPEAIRDRADEILSRPEFERHKTLVQRALEWIGDQLNRISFGVGGGPGFMGDLIGLLFLAGAIVLVVVLVRSIRRTSRRPEPEPDLSVEEISRRSSADWRADAERFEAEQRWREAMRARYRELVRTLVDDRVLADVAGRTTGEYDHELAAAVPAAADAFSELTERFEDVWYGGQEADAEELRRFRSLAGEVRDRARPTQGRRADLAGVS